MESETAFITTQLMKEVCRPPIWIDDMSAALKSRPNRDYPQPEGIVWASMDPKTGKRATSGDILEPFKKGTEPGKGGKNVAAPSTSDFMRSPSPSPLQHFNSTAAGVDPVFVDVGDEILQCTAEPFIGYGRAGTGPCAVRRAARTWRAFRNGDTAEGRDHLLPHECRHGV